MMDLLERADPGREAHADTRRLRALVDERIGSWTPRVSMLRRPWLNAAIAFAGISVIVAVVAVLRSSEASIYAPKLDGLRELSGIEDVVKLASGGVQTAAVDGDTIWVMSALAHQLQRISGASGDLEMTYEIDTYVEGVVGGGGYVWLLSYDNGGEVLRFDPELGAVDERVPLGGAPAHGAAWFDDHLWVSTDRGELLQISARAEIVATFTGELKGEGLGHLWINDPATGVLSSFDKNGARNPRISIPTSADGTVRGVIEADNRLWLMDNDFPRGTDLRVFDPASGDLEFLGGITFGLLSMVEFEGSLWLTSNTDHLLVRVDPGTGDITRFPMPGKAGGLFVADQSLWVSLYHPSALVRINPDELLAAAEIVADDRNRFPHRLLCTGSETGPTVILEPNSWIDYGSWSVIQAQLSERGYQVCANGYVEGEATPEQRATALAEALIEAGIAGPYTLVAAGDGVHSARLFAQGRTDMSGVVLIDPSPIGFQAFYDELLPDLADHPPWADPETPISNDLSDTPLIIIHQDPTAVFLSRQFIEGAGLEAAEAVNRYWRNGLEFYAGLSSDSQLVEAEGTGLDNVLWDRPELIVDSVVNVSGKD